MSGQGFDREWHLGELLDSVSLARLGPALAELLAGDVAILDFDETLLWGVFSPSARRQPVVLELEPIGFVVSKTAEPSSLLAATRVLTALLRAELRFKMASTLHLEAVAEDFESLKREHAHLLESETRYRKLSEELESRVKVQVAALEERQQML